jgi:multidrug resistance efflux pump
VIRSLVIAAMLASGSALAAAEEPSPRPLLLTGEVVALDAQEIIVPASNSNPVVLRKYVPDGAVVKKGDVVLAIDPGGQASQIGSLETQIEQAHAKVERETADLEVKEVEAEQALATAEATLAKAKVDAAIPRNFVSALDYDRYQGERERASRDLEVKQSQLANARTAVARRIEDGKLEVRKLEMGLAFAEAQIASSSVTARMDGVVVHGFSPWRGRRFDEGESGFSGASVGQVIGDSALSVRTWVLEADRHHLKEGQEVRIRFDALPGVELKSLIGSISTAPEARAAWGEGRYFRTDLTLPKDNNLALTPGMSALVQPVAQKEPATQPVAESRNLKLDGELIALQVSAVMPPSIKDVWNYNLVMLLPEGSMVQPGQPVAIFDAADLGTRLPQKQSQLNEKTTQRSKLLLDHAEAAKAAELAVAEAASGLEKARRKAEQPPDTIKRIDYDKLVIEKVLAEQNAKLAIAKRDAQARARRAELAQTDADIGLLKDEVKELEEARSKLTVVAARPGVVSHRTQFNGEKFAVGTSVFMGLSVAEVADPTTIVVQAMVAEPEAHRIRLGQIGRVAIAGGNTVLDARVTELGKVYRTKSRNQPVTVRDVRLMFDKPPEQLKPGATVTVNIDVGQADAAVAVRP